MKIEKVQYEEVKEIEQLFKKKLKHEGEAFLQLEQEGLEMEQQFDKQIKTLRDTLKWSASVAYICAVSAFFLSTRFKVKVSTPCSWLFNMDVMVFPSVK